MGEIWPKVVTVYTRNRAFREMHGNFVHFAKCTRITCISRNALGSHVFPEMHDDWRAFREMHSDCRAFRKVHRNCHVYCIEGA